MTYRKKLIEVALPLEAINRSSRSEKSPFTRSHPRALHVWWARRPLAACRAVLFASLIDDPSSWPELFPNEEAQDLERERLFRIIEELVRWESINNKAMLLTAQREIAQSISRSRGDDMPKEADAIHKYLKEYAPPVLDPFCGGGSIPLEAQRLGLKAIAGDLNPVAVLITKALIEIPPKFVGKPPVNPDAYKEKGLIEREWQGAEGLVEDICYYGKWMRDESEKLIGHLYPKAKITEEMIKDQPDLKPHAGEELTVMAWLWVRTVECPNPACRARMPLASSFVLSGKKNKRAWVEPIINAGRRGVNFLVRTGDGTPPEAPKVGRGAKFRCLVCGETSESQYIKDEGTAGRMGAQLMAIVAKSRKGLIYLPPDDEHSKIASNYVPSWRPEVPLADDPRNIWCRGYGINTFEKLFTLRQLVALNTFSDLVMATREKILEDARISDNPYDYDGRTLDSGGTGVIAYADAVATYLALSISRFADFSNTITSWDSGNTNLRQLFSRQAIQMSWDYAETNPLHGVVNIMDAINWAISSISNTIYDDAIEGTALQIDASSSLASLGNAIVSTDPPYYDNISYADLSDFFYIWLRRSLSQVHPDLFSTLASPKKQELIASPYRFNGNNDMAENFFQKGLESTFHQIRLVMNREYTFTLFYAFKQREQKTHVDGKAMASTGWETMLRGLIEAGFVVVGTWPMRTEQQQRSIAMGTNALATSIVLVCRLRQEDAPMTTRRDFISTLKNELPKALVNLQHGNIAPVDLAQASIGPGMAVFTRYSKVMEADGSPMTVRAALVLINQTLDEVLAEQEGEFDADTRWAVAWFEQFGMEEGPFGVAETLSKAKDTAVSGMVEAGILYARGGKVRLLKRDELQDDWDPATDSRFTIWEATQHLIRALDQNGEQAAAELLRKLGAVGESARDLAYRLYNICERKKWAQEALAYNSLVIAWPEISRLAQGTPGRAEAQTDMFESE
ncbi:MAG: DUF1156 domain-containing protein [Anaerolineae bacterium]|nr:DUF1156 domain-containing protein [Anaerolineae bacterium]